MPSSARSRKGMWESGGLTEEKTNNMNLELFDHQNIHFVNMARYHLLCVI